MIGSMTKHDNNYTDTLLEEIRDQMKAVLEISTDTRDYVKNLPTHNEFNDLRQDVKTIKTAVKDTNSDLKLLERRVVNIEEKAA